MILVLGVFAHPLRALELSGVAAVQDGDTIRIGEQVIRLNGIDAPESGQDCERGGRSYNCGAKAENKLRALLRGGVSCSGEQFDDFGRLLADCVVDSGNVSALMVRSGWALAFLKYSTAYVSEEDEARAGGHGL